MNGNDARAAAMAPLFGGPGTQPVFVADYRNRDNGLIYEMNTKDWKEGKNLDFTPGASGTTALLNKTLSQDPIAGSPIPPPRHRLFPPEPAKPPAKRNSKRSDPD